MAIKIASSNIYDNKHSLPKNALNAIGYRYETIKKEIDYDVIVGSAEIDLHDTSLWFDNSRSDSEVYTYTYGDYKTVYSTEATAYDIINIPITFKERRNNGKEIATKLYGDKIESTISAKKKKYYFNSNGEWELESETDISDIPTRFSQGQYAVVDLGNTNNIATQIPTLNNGEYSTTISRTVASEVIYVTDTTGAIESGRVTKTKEVYTPIDLTITYYGETTKYVFTEKNGVVTMAKEEERNNYSAAKNELYTENNTYKGVNIALANANRIESVYKNGRETYELLCSVKEYYNEDGTVAVSTKGQVGGKTKMLFDIGDVVIPYKPTAAGDKPISYKKDGKTPKPFKVVGVTPIFDGAVWQKLNIIEETARTMVITTPSFAESDYVEGTLLYGAQKNLTFNLFGFSDCYYNGAKIGQDYDAILHSPAGSHVLWQVDAMFKDGVLNLKMQAFTANLVYADIEPMNIEFTLS